MDSPQQALSDRHGNGDAPGLPQCPIVEQFRPTVVFPCDTLPRTGRASGCFDSVDVMEKIENHFNQVDPTQSFRSLVLHGPSGVGKSIIAMRYAEIKLKRGEVDVVFWIDSQTENSITLSFEHMVENFELQYDCAPYRRYPNNGALIMNWLQYPLGVEFRRSGSIIRRECRWLIIYDNAEDTELIHPRYWPNASQGQVLITRRSPTFASDIADGGLEITAPDPVAPSRSIIRHLSTQIGSELKHNNTASAHELSQEISGHALALSHMAWFLDRHTGSTDESRKPDWEHPSQAYGISGNKSIDALWELSFKSLDEYSSAILSVLCFLQPDNVPLDLFEPKNISNWPDTLSFCIDRPAFSEAIEKLVTLALIKIDKESRTLSLDRLVQTSVKNFLGIAGRETSFNDAVVVVSQAFPRRDSDVAQLYLMWERCSVYLPHVLSLKDCFRDVLKECPGFAVRPSYCDLNNACQRYLLEINAYSDLEDLIEVNTMALNTLSPESQTIALQGSLTSHKGQLFIRLGRTEEGVEWLRKSYEIRSHDVPFNDRESAWAAENLANGIATLNNFTEAIEWYERARDHWQTWSNQQAVGTGEWPACIKKSMAMALIWSGDSIRARNMADMALAQIQSTTPYNWAMAAYTHFAVGTIDRHGRNFEAAEAHFMEAQNSWLEGNQLRTDPFNAACMYRLGCNALDQGKLEAAVKHLQDARYITEMRKDQMVAEHMRCLFKLSEALEQEPRGEGQARRLRETAEQLLRQRVPQADFPGLAATYDQLVNILWR
ncbi:Tetratricopeptide-like helical [Nemania sp. FL0031]|nr:Tetratricopeptide-like helical [Nemania sp. FL0031]